MSRRRSAAAHAPALLAFAALNILAAPAVQAAIGSCTVTATGVAFGTYTPLSATALSSTGTVSIACSGVSRRNSITIDLTAGASGNYAARTLTSGAFTLDYNLYLDAANTAVWGNGTGNTVQGTATIRRRTPNATLTVYGAVAAGQDPPAGAYGDTITVTVSY